MERARLGGDDEFKRGGRGDEELQLAGLQIVLKQTFQPRGDGEERGEPGDARRGGPQGRRFGPETKGREPGGDDEKGEGGRSAAALSDRKTQLAGEDRARGRGGAHAASLARAASAGA